MEGTPEARPCHEGRGCVVFPAWGTPPVKEVIPMRHFLRDVAALALADVIAAVVVHLLNL